jgi:dienelactone hydrolase
MGEEIVLFHSALGLRPAVREFADHLRAAGHTVHTPDLFEGALFDNLAEGMRRRDEIGIEALIGRAQAAVEGLPDPVVFGGFSMGSTAAEFLAATRPGARAAILMHGAFDPAAFGIEAWPDVPVQVHYANGDPEVDLEGIRALESAVGAAGSPVEVYAYDGGGHLFEDAAYDGHNAASAESMRKRVLGFLTRLGTISGSKAERG